ncbi:sensor histidine kinase [Edaphobacter modestus]|uniref:histidine kinase n=1 Tax=Edaphobacter modestus TaxID=388466 RepID=A0A4Q7Z0E0_9BACT|nr:ATP-binding protein [Edaphobacter modestus]RZU43677.1 signal transduction histidine kinase [Edaphobacter modestus]
MRSLSVRAKLTLWYLAVISTALLLFGLLTFGALRYALLKVKQATLNRREHRLILYLEQNRQKHALAPLSEQLASYALITHEGNLFQIRDLRGSLIFPFSPAAAAWLSHPAAECAPPVFRDVIVEGQPVTVVCHTILLDGQPVMLYIGGSLEEDMYILSTYQKTLLFLLPCLLGLSAVGGYFLSRRAMRPVDLMTKAALEIGIGNLSSRLPIPSARDEIWSLAIAWNQLLDRLEGAVSRLSKFSADASHDLRTSITVILATAQVSLDRRRLEEEYRSDLERIVSECRIASTLLDAQLSLARSGNFIHEVAFQRVNVTELVVAGCRRVEDLAESSGIILDWKLPADDLFVEGDELLLQRLLGILLDNAIKYTPAQGEILVEVCGTQSEVFLTVRDTGIGMSEDVRQHIFDRFYQADLRERRNLAGSGLGLSIAKWIAEAHRVEFVVESTPMKGSEFQIRFPAAASLHSGDTVRTEYSLTLP